jgi:hypothetical protein
VHFFDAPFPSYFPENLDLLYFSFATQFNSVFILVKFEISLMQFSFIFSSNFFLLPFFFVAFYV